MNPSNPVVICMNEMRDSSAVQVDDNSEAASQ